jgi:hypothetical protein
MVSIRGAGEVVTEWEDADFLVKKYVEVRINAVSGEVSQNFLIPVGYELM